MKDLLRRFLAGPWWWGLLAFVTYYHYAQFIPTVSWNAIELIIARHLHDHGAYVTSIDYPSALPWRPVLPTLIIAFLQNFTADPIRIYQVFCGSALASLVMSLFLAARTLWGRMAAHVAALAAFTCPGVTIYLINHAHSYSHVGGLLLIGPAIAASIGLLHRLEKSLPASWYRYAGTGLLWGCGYLCRSELLLFFLLFVGVVGWTHLARRRNFLPLLALGLGFLGPFLSYDRPAGRAARQDGLLIRNPIYGFYISQGWADPPPDVGPDIEADGYVYAKKLYGTPEENHASLLQAIRHNPEAFARRVGLNARAFYHRYVDPEFFRAWLFAPIMLLLLALLAGRIPADEHRSLWFLISLFLAAHFILIFHIDTRYLTIGVPALLLLAAGGIHHLLNRLHRMPRLVAGPLIGLILAGILYGSAGQLEPLRHHRGRNMTSIPALSALGRAFLPHADLPRPTGNREPHIRLIFPAQSPLFPEDQFLLAYFSHTAWVNGGAEGAFPRGRFYSYRDCPDDYQYIPAERMDDAGLIGAGKIIAEVDAPGIGRYYLLQTRL